MSRKTTRRRRTALTNPIALALHKDLFQLKQLSYGEYQAAWRLMVGRVTSSGGDLIREGVTA